MRFTFDPVHFEKGIYVNQIAQTLNNNEFNLHFSPMMVYDRGNHSNNKVALSQKYHIEPDSNISKIVSERLQTLRDHRKTEYSAYMKRRSPFRSSAI